MTQQEALNILKMGYSVYLTGEAGTGKTYVLNSFIPWLREHGVEPSVTASTGIAATHLGGTTIHSWSGIGIRDKITSYDLDLFEQKKALWNRFENAKILIIDEISMLSGGFLDMLDKVSKHMKRSEKPFGGMQVVFCGDFFQLPPISRDTRARYAFESKSWGELNPVTCYLTEQYRQSDKNFSSLLSSIRQRSGDEEVRMALLERQGMPLPEKQEITRLFTHNIDVDALNEQRLSKIKHSEQVFEMESKGKAQYVEALMRGCLAPEILRLKKGAEVMFVKNDQQGQYANGTQGKIYGFENNVPVVRTKSGRLIHAWPQVWRMEDEGKVLAEITQVPLRLAWAITVHKSQGMTLDAAEVDLSKAFVPGQGYVALSRVRTLDGLYLRGFNDTALEVDDHVLSSDRQFREHSRVAGERLGKLDEKEIAKRQESFIVYCGGTVERVSREEPAPIVKKERIPTKEVTRRLLEEGRTLKEAAKDRGLKLTTILTHAESLIKEGASFDFSYLAPPENILVVLEKATKKDNFEYLGPVKGRLDRQGHGFSYEELRLYRLYMRSIGR